MMTKHVTHKYAKNQINTRQEIADYMSAPALSIESDSTVRDTAQFMHQKNIGSVLVKENEEFIGIVTEKDLTRKVLGNGLNPETTKVTVAMTAQPLFSLDCHLPVTEANAFMAKKKIRHLPVTEDGVIVGMISVRDLFAFYANPRFR